MAAAVVRAGEGAAGIVMRDVNGRFAAPFVMPSGRRERVLLTLEHLLGTDAYLQMRGLGVRLDTFTRAEVAERICEALAFLHRHAIVASDIAPNNLLVAFGAGDEPEVCFIDCDSMVFHGRQALTSVQTGDWDIPESYGESPGTRAADAYKLGLVVLRLFARSHDARAAGPWVQHVPAELRDLLARSLAADAVNRPPAGEWQRALRGALANGHLNERYPGPAPARRVVAPVRTLSAPAGGVAAVGPVSAATRTVAPASAAAGVVAGRALWLAAERRAMAPACGCGGVDRRRRGGAPARAVPAVLRGDSGAGRRQCRRGLAVRLGRDQPVPLPAVRLPAEPDGGAWVPGTQHHSLITYGDLTGRGIRWPTRRKCASSLADGLPEPRSWGPAAAPGRDSRPGPPAGPQTVRPDSPAGYGPLLSVHTTLTR